METIIEEQVRKRPSRRAGATPSDDNGVERVSRRPLKRLWWAGVAAVVLAVAATAGWRVLDLSGRSNELLVGADDFAFSSLELKARRGMTEVTFANTDAVTHTFTIAELGLDLVVASGEAGTATFEARPGRYQFLCTIPGHDVPGMRGVLRVK